MGVLTKDEYQIVFYDTLVVLWSQNMSYKNTW